MAAFLYYLELKTLVEIIYENIIKI